MSLRIVAGDLGGRFIDAPRGRGTRPTAERVREAWFSALAPDLPDATVLDLFAGSGALGIEALSRGARHAHFVESDRRAVAVLKENLRRLEVADRATVVAGDVFRWLDETEAHWRLALADPPYAGEVAERLVARFTDRPFARCLWLEHAASAGDPGPDPSWTRRYGDSKVSRFCSAEDDEGV